MRSTTAVSAPLVLLLSLAACEGSDPAAPADSAEALDDAVALVAAEAALEDLAIMDGMVPFGLGASPRDRSGLVRERTVTFRAADGGVMDGYDPELTASIHTSLTVAGEITGPHVTTTLSRERELTVSGLLGQETTRTFDGTGEEDHASTRVTDQHGTRSYRFEATAEIASVMRPVGPTDAPWPLSGTITRQVRVTRTLPSQDAPVVRERTVVLTFNGTRYAILSVNGVEYEVDLAAGPEDRPARRRNP